MTKFLNNADIKGYIAQTAVTSYLLKADSTGRLVAAIAGTDYQAPTTALLPSGGTAGQILAKIDGTNYNTQWIDNFAQQLKHDVKLGATIAKGKAVYVSSANGTNMIVSAASNASEATSSKTLGLLETGGVTNDTVKVVTEGLLAGLDTSTATAGDPVWLGTSGNLIFGLANKPVAPAHMVFIGIVTRSQSVNGEIFVKVQNGFELDELHNVGLSSVANNEGLFYDSATSLWKNKTIAAVLGYTPANGANYLPLTGGTLTGDLTLSGTNPRLYFTDTDNNPDYFISNTDGTFTVYDVTNSVGRFKIYSGGNAELSGALVGTTATFSSTAGNQIVAYYGVSDYLNIQHNGLTTKNNQMNLGTNLSSTPTMALVGTSVGIGTVSPSSLPSGGGGIFSVYQSAAASLWLGGNTLSLDGQGTARDLYFYFRWSSSAIFQTDSYYKFLINSTEIVRLQATGQLRLNAYTTSTSFSGTAAGYLAFDSSGNVITVAGVAATDNTKLPLAGGTMTGDITINGQRIKELSSTNKGIYIGNWFGAGYWGLGSTATAHELKLDQVNTTTGAWENATDVNLYLGNNRLVLHSGNYSSYALPLTGGTLSGLVAFSNVTGNKIDFYHTTTGSGDRYGVQVQNSELRIHSGAGGDGSGGITFGKSTTTTFTETMRVRNDGNVLLANTGTLILGIDDTMDRTVVGGASRTRLQLAPPSHTGAEWTFVTYDDSSNAYIRIGYGNGSSSFQMRHDGYTTIAGNVLLHAANYNSYSPTLTGVGASGTWGINITGNANNITQYTINQNLGTGNDVTHAILRASSYVVTPLIYSGGGNVVLGNNLQVGSGLSTNSTYDANFFGRFTPDGKYLTRNWQLNDGGYTWSSLNYTQISDSPIGSYTMRGNNNSYTAQRQSGWVAIDRTKTYKVSVWYRTISGSPLVYLSFTQAGWDLSQPDNGGWGQPYFAVVNTSSTTWQEFTMTIGPSGSGAGYTWYSYARYAQLGVLMNYNNSGNAEITGFKMEEVDSTLANNTTVLGDSLYVGTSTSSNIYMTDSDESTRRIHCNSGRIGFLNTSASWGAYCDNSGNWISDNSLRAPIFYDSNDTAYYLDPNSTGTSLNVAGTVRGSYYVASNYASTGYTQYKGYDNNNHFIMVRGRVTGNTTSPTYTGYHRTSLVEYAEANDDTGWFFQTAATGNYDIVARITRSYSQFEGSVRAPIFYDSNDTGYYLDLNSTSDSAMRIRGGALFGPNPTWGAYLMVGSNGRGNSSYASVATTSGNLHLDPASGYSTYINYYSNGPIYLNGSTYSISSNGSYYNGTASYANSAGSLSNMNISQFTNNSGYITSSGNTSGYASYLPTSYVGGVQSNPQVYFNYSIGLKVAMTGHWSVWSDTMWVNGYAGGDVPWMCALHFLRNSEPRFAISAQQRDSGSYGTVYEVITSYNIANQTVSTANNLSGFDKTNPSFGAVYSSNWFRAYGDCGLYTQDYGGHFRRNTYSYGTWETFGYNKNGYGGIVVNNNYVTAQMHNSSGDYGFLTENGNWWNLFYNNGNNCWGIGTDNTYSGDGFRCIKYGSAQYGWTTWSDRRAKENISTITGALDKVLNMRGVYFNYIIDEAKNKRVGFIAQELQQALPEAVRYAEEIDEYNVEYGQIVSVLAEAVKEHYAKTVAQQIEIEALKTQLQTLLN